ncbi:Fic family protein [Sulfitobacter sp. PR48]
MVGNHGFTDGNKRTAWILVELLIKTRVVVREDW